MSKHVSIALTDDPQYLDLVVQCSDPYTNAGQDSAAPGSQLSRPMP